MRKISEHSDPQGDQLYTIYCLRLRGGYFYVGRTKDLNRRVAEHEQSCEGESSNTTSVAWLRLHPYLHLEEKWDNRTIWDEDMIVKQLMHKYGIERVRGGSYAQPELTRALHREMIGATDRCYKCGKEGHFSAQCPDRLQFNRSQSSHDNNIASRSNSDTVVRSSNSNANTSARSNVPLIEADVSLGSQKKVIISGLELLATFFGGKG